MVDMDKTKDESEFIDVLVEEWSHSHDFTLVRREQGDFGNRGLIAYFVVTRADTPGESMVARIEASRWLVRTFDVNCCGVELDNLIVLHSNQRSVVHRTTMASPIPAMTAALSDRWNRDVNARMARKAAQ